MITAATIFQASGGSGGFGGFLIRWGLMFAIMYFLVIMPQRAPAQEMQAMLAELKAGDKVITSGGISWHHQRHRWRFRHFENLQRTASKIRIARSAIAQVEASEDAK